MTIEFRAVEATCGLVMDNAQLLESQFFDDAPARLVSVEVPDTDCASVATPCPVYLGATQCPVS